MQHTATHVEMSLRAAERGNNALFTLKESMHFWRSIYFFIHAP